MRASWIWFVCSKVVTIRCDPQVAASTLFVISEKHFHADTILQYCCAVLSCANDDDNLRLTKFEDSTMDLVYQLGLIGLLSFGGTLFTYWTIPQVSPMFIKAGLSGIDLCKKDRKKRMYVDSTLLNLDLSRCISSDACQLTTTMSQLSLQCGVSGCCCRLRVSGHSLLLHPDSVYAVQFNF